MIQIRRFHESIQIGHRDEVFSAWDADDRPLADGRQVVSLGPWETVTLGSVDEAAYWLRRLNITEEEHPLLRSLLTDDQPGLWLTGRKTVIEQIGHGLAVGQLVMRRRAAQPQPIARTAARSPQPPPPPASAPARRAPASAPPPPVHDGTFSVDADLAAQVAAIVAAAQSGVPFCEMCEKAREEEAAAAGEAQA